MIALPRMNPTPNEHPRAGWLLVTNKGDCTLSIVDPTTNREIAAIPHEGVTGHEIAVSLDGKRAFVPIYSDANVGEPGTDGQLVRVFDLEKRKIVGTIDFGKGVRPHCAVVCRQSGLLYVTTELDISVTIVDPVTLVILGSVPTGAALSHMLAITRDGHRGYTANIADGTVSVLDLEKKSLLKTIPISRMTQRISLSVDDRYVFTADQCEPRIAVIDTQVNEVTKWIALPGIAFGTAPTPDGRFLFVALPHINEVAIVDLATMKVARTVKVPPSPQEVLVRPDCAVAYVSCDASKQVAVINVAEARLETLIAVGTDADGLAWAATG